MISGDQPSLTDPKERKRKRERDRYAKLSDQQKDELLQKCRETRQQKKVLQGELQCTSKQIEPRRTKARARYANLTPEQRQAIRDRQRLLRANMTSEQKQVKRNREKAYRTKRRNAPSKKSIAMINPLHNSSDSN